MREHGSQWFSPQMKVYVPEKLKNCKSLNLSVSQQSQSGPNLVVGRQIKKNCSYDFFFNFLGLEEKTQRPMSPHFKQFYKNIHYTLPTVHSQCESK